MKTLRIENIIPADGYKSSEVEDFIRRSEKTPPLVGGDESDPV